MNEASGQRVSMEPALTEVNAGHAVLGADAQPYERSAVTLGGSMWAGRR